MKNTESPEAAANKQPKLQLRKFHKTDAGNTQAATPFSTVMVQRNPGGPCNDSAALHGARHGDDYPYIERRVLGCASISIDESTGEHDGR